MKYFLLLLIIAILLYKFESNLNVDKVIKILAILGFLITFYTLYCNFLKPPKLELKIGKRVLLIWHDNVWKSAPMIDAYCTIINDGARPIIIDKICVELNKDKNKINFNDYLFLKLVEGKRFELKEYSHPIVIEKYSSKSIMIGFKNEDIEYIFKEGKYILTVKAFKKNKSVAKDSIDFELTKENINQINKNKANNKNDATEIYF